MTKIKCRKCGKVYPFDEKICPICGYDIREDPKSYREETALHLGLGSEADLFARTTIKKLWNAGSLNLGTNV